MCIGKSGSYHCKICVCWSYLYTYVACSVTIAIDSGCKSFCKLSVPWNSAVGIGRLVLSIHVHNTAVRDLVWLCVRFEHQYIELYFILKDHQASINFMKQANESN